MRKKVKPCKTFLTIFLKFAKFCFTSKIKNNFRAEDDIDDLKIIRSIIEDLTAVRFAKINKLLEAVTPESLTLNLNNICAREFEQIRPFVSEVLPLKLETLNCK